MNPNDCRILNCFKKEPNERIEQLNAEVNNIKTDIRLIKCMNFSAEVEQLCIYELNKKLIEVKNKMHKLINEM